MSDLVAAVPPNNPDHDAMVDYGLIGVSTFLPLVGQPIVDIVRGGIARRDAERQYDFNVQIARALEEVVDLAAGWTVESVLGSDEFMAAVSKGSRAASETASVVKRSRLARGVAQSGPWTNLTERRRQQFLDMVVRYDDIHILVLAFFSDPSAWLIAHSDWHPGRWRTVGIDRLLNEYVFPGNVPWREVLGPALGLLQTDGLIGPVPLDHSMTESGAVEPRIYPSGRDFLEFLGETAESQ